MPVRVRGRARVVARGEGDGHARVPARPVHALRADGPRSGPCAHRGHGARRRPGRVVRPRPLLGPRHALGGVGPAGLAAPVRARGVRGAAPRGVEGAVDEGARARAPVRGVPRTVRARDPARGGRAALPAGPAGRLVTRVQSAPRGPEQGGPGRTGAAPLARPEPPQRGAGAPGKGAGLKGSLN